MTTTPLDHMRKQAAAYAQCRDQLAALVQAMKDEMSTIERGAMPAILRAARRIATLHDELRASIEAHPECFTKPRSVVVDGLKFGLQKQKGKMSWASDEELAQRVKALAREGAIDPGQVNALIEYRPKPVAAALEQLDAKLLKRLGVTVSADTDAPLIKTVDGDVEKLVAQIVKQASQAEAA
ncbi:MAG: hypothetical protein Q4F13_06820 [Pseudomonadota bacterium]|nr:hypothetical protein [Pseudomonadota bacterium]